MTGCRGCFYRPDVTEWTHSCGRVVSGRRRRRGEVFIYHTPPSSSPPPPTSPVSNEAREVEGQRERTAEGTFNSTQ